MIISRIITKSTIVSNSNGVNFNFDILAHNLLHLHVSNSNGVNFNIKLNCALLAKLQVSNSNGVNFNALLDNLALSTILLFQTPTE